MKGKGYRVGGAIVLSLMIGWIAVGVIGWGMLGGKAMVERVKATVRGMLWAEKVWLDLKDAEERWRYRVVAQLDEDEGSGKTIRIEMWQRRSEKGWKIVQSRTMGGIKGIQSIYQLGEGVEVVFEREGKRVWARLGEGKMEILR